MVADIDPAVPSRLPWPGSRYPPRTDNLVVTAESGHQRADRPTDERHPVRVSQTTVHQGRLLFGDSRDRILRLCLCVPAGIRPSFWSHGIEISRHRSRAGAHRGPRLRNEIDRAAVHDRLSDGGWWGDPRWNRLVVGARQTQAPVYEKLGEGPHEPTE